jgi:hypothetical protein
MTAATKGLVKMPRAKAVRATTPSAAPQTLDEFCPAEHRTYLLRSCAADMTAWGGFLWPREGYVEAPDWNKRPECGHGLHGLRMGLGDAGLLSWDEAAVWLVCAVDARELVEIGTGKVKAPRAWVLFAGPRQDAAAHLVGLGAVGVPAATVVAGDSGTATAGDSGTATAGDRGTATAGDRGTATAGYSGTATAGNRGTATAGYSGTATAGDRGTATAGDRGTATAGNSGTATAGYSGTATAGYSGTATAGDRGTATAGNSGTATAGKDGIVIIRLWTGSRYRLVVGTVGEEGIEPGVPYRLDANGKFVRADNEQVAPD